MPSEEQTNQTNPIDQSSQPIMATSNAGASDVVVQPTSDATTQSTSDAVVQPNIATAPLERSASSIINEIIGKISSANNILIALSSDPTVDDLAAAIGFSLYLDRIGKHTTAIYSGTTPNALEFLKPKETFESTADTLQDFVIAIDKDKADHLRYKLDGDYVKIFITPYRKRIDEADLEFSYGDYNVDLVFALDVNNGIDLDSALREYGRIMHDASVVNITTGNPGKFGEIEWSDKKASSVSEMVSKLIYETENGTLEKDEATAFLTGIIAATDRFSKTNTTPDTMQVASRLMQFGADQQLIAKNITSDVNKQLSDMSAEKAKAEGRSTEEKIIDPEAREEDIVGFNINHEEETPVEPTPTPEPTVAEPGLAIESKELLSEPEPAASSDALLADLKAAEASLADAASETIEEKPAEPLRVESTKEKTLTPSEEFLSEASEGSPSKFSEMMDEALSEVKPAEPISAPEPIPAPEPAPLTPTEPAPAPAPNFDANPALTVAPEAPSTPEINGVPEINYAAAPADEVLPPPPAPPVNLANPASSAPSSSAFQIPNFPG